MVWSNKKNMTSITSWLKNSRYTPPLSQGCKQCSQGSKLVLLITGLCPANCFYCPLSFKKKDNDVIYANEWKLKNEKDTETILNEATLIDAQGAGITGGDPFSVWERTIRYIHLLKNHYDETFHIHLYTSGLVNANKILEVIDAGLDEIRFHPMPQTWNKMEKNPIKKAINTAVDSAADVAIEIPAIPGMKKEIIHLIEWAEHQHIDYINLNELEFSEQNEDALYQKGFITKNDLSAAVKNSETTAQQIIDHIAQMNLDIGVHYCSASFKDAIQLTNRMKRRATHIAHSFDIITKQGTIIKGVIDHIKQEKKDEIIFILNAHHINNNEYCYQKNKQRIEINPHLLEKIALSLKNKGYHCFLIEEYPTKDALEVERQPLQ